MNSLTFGSGPNMGWAEDVPLAGEPTPTSLDLSGLAEAEPLRLLRLAALLDRHQASDCPLSVEPLRDPVIRRRLTLMQVDCETRLLGLADSSATHPEDRGLLPVCRFSTANQVDDLAGRLQLMLNEHFKGVLEPLAQPLFVALSELCENATTHGSNPLGAYVGAQRDHRKRCLLAIGDLGIGIPAHIRRAHPAAGDDGSAIDKALRPGISGAGPDRGVGYSGLFSAIEESKVPAARLRIWSAEGRLTATLRRGRFVYRKGRSISRQTDGTWVSLELLAN
jgi:hypothetical protein